MSHGLHLSHGLGSMFQSIGWKSRAYGPCLDKAARVVAMLIFLGYTSIPVAIMLGYGKEHSQVISGSANGRLWSVMVGGSNVSLSR